MTDKPKYKLCWNCNRKFHGNHHATVETENHAYPVDTQRTRS